MENLVAIELAYVNTRHPDFDEARLIYRGLTDDGVDSSDLRKVSAHNAMTHGGTSSKQVCEFPFYYRIAYMQGGLRDGKRVRPSVRPSHA